MNVNVNQHIIITDKAGACVGYFAPVDDNYDRTIFLVGIEAEMEELRAQGNNAEETVWNALHQMKQDGFLDSLDIQSAEVRLNKMKQALEAKQAAAQATK